MSRMAYSLGNSICTVSCWELKVGVASNLSAIDLPGLSANKKRVDSLIAWLIPTIVLSDLLVAI